MLGFVCCLFICAIWFNINLSSKWWTKSNIGKSPYFAGLVKSKGPDTRSWSQKKYLKYEIISVHKCRVRVCTGLQSICREFAMPVTYPFSYSSVFLHVYYIFTLLLHFSYNQKSVRKMLSTFYVTGNVITWYMVLRETRKKYATLCEIIYLSLWCLKTLQFSLLKRTRHVCVVYKKVTPNSISFGRSSKVVLCMY